VSVLVFIVLAVATLVGVELLPGQVGELLSGGMILLMNLLVASRWPWGPGR
jgi:multicomponent Na+:H+ antiporter subunit B